MRRADERRGLTPPNPWRLGAIVFAVAFAAPADELGGLGTNALVATEAQMGAKSYVVSARADHYRTGKAGELGTGWAHTAVCGDGSRRFAALAPKIAGTLRFTGEGAEDTFCRVFGTAFDLDDCAAEVTDIRDWTETGFTGYNAVTVRYALPGGCPLTATVSKNALAGGVATLDALGGDSWCDVQDADGNWHYFYNIVASGDGVTYTDGDTGYTHSFNVALEETGGDAVEMTVFGDGGAYLLDGDLDQVRKLGTRTGKAGERGTGWGYKVYDFATDRRTWEVHAPRLDATPVASSAQRYMIIGGDYGYRYVWLCPFTYAENFSASKEVVRTEGAWGEDGCEAVVWRVGMFPLDPARPDGECLFAFEATNRVGTATGWDGLALVSAFDGYATTVTDPTKSYIVYQLSDFALDGVATNGSTLTVGYTYDTLVRRYNSYDKAWHTVTNFTARQTVTLKAYPATLEKAAFDDSLLVTDRTQHLIWDEGLKATWEVCVTNGCFYTEIISNRDYRREDVR